MRVTIVAVVILISTNANAQSDAGIDGETLGYGCRFDSDCAEDETCEGICIPESDEPTEWVREIECVHSYFTVKEIYSNGCIETEACVSTLTLGRERPDLRRMYPSFVEGHLNLCEVNEEVTAHYYNTDCDTRVVTTTQKYYLPSGYRRYQTGQERNADGTTVTTYRFYPEEEWDFVVGSVVSEYFVDGVPVYCRDNEDVNNCFERYCGSPSCSVTGNRSSSNWFVLMLIGLLITGLSINRKKTFPRE